MFFSLLFLRRTGVPLLTGLPGWDLKATPTRKSKHQENTDSMGMYLYTYKIRLSQNDLPAEYPDSFANTIAHFHGSIFEIYTNHRTQKPCGKDMHLTACKEVQLTILLS